MSWKDCDLMNVRMKFVARLLEGEKMTDLCKEFEISRKTGYKIYNRFNQMGVNGLKNLSTSAIYRPNQIENFILKHILETKAKFPTWGAPKIKSYLERKHSTVKIPAKSTIHEILDRNNLVKKKTRNNKYKSKGTVFAEVSKPNDLWCADHKGKFRMQNNQYCYPLTITDQYSRFLLTCEALENTSEEEAFTVFENAFKEYGLPDAIRSDNGVPFGSNSYFGLSKLSVWWLRMGIRIERIKPGNPQENGQHERMHRTLKMEVTKPPGKNLINQQERHDEFSQVFNHERPHQSIGMKCPKDLYIPSKRKFPEMIDELFYPNGHQECKVARCGTIRPKIENSFYVYIGQVFANENVGITEEDDGIWSVKFMNYHLGFFDRESRALSKAPNPFFAERMK